MSPPTRTWPTLQIRFLSQDPDAHLQDRLLVDLDETDATGLEEIAPGLWRVYFRSSKARDRAAAAVEQHAGRVVEIERLVIADAGWAQQSQAGLRAIRVGRLVVAPPWDLPRESDAAGAATVLVVQPSMGFGTGHHASTRLCLQALQDLPLDGRSVLDVGTGSGVLAVAAIRLGAARVLAIDSDPDAIQAAGENLSLNGLGQVIDLRIADFREAGSLCADVVLANLTGTIIARHARQLAALTHSGGHLVLGGFTAEEEDAVLHAFGTSYVPVWRAAEDEWVALTLHQSAS